MRSFQRHFTFPGSCPPWQGISPSLLFIKFVMSHLSKVSTKCIKCKKTVSWLFLREPKTLILWLSPMILSRVQEQKPIAISPSCFATPRIITQNLMKSLNFLTIVKFIYNSSQANCWIVFKQMLRTKRKRPFQIQILKQNKQSVLPWIYIKKL